MLFSSITFLFYFLPILLIIYFIVPKKFKNLVLFIFSLFFYFYGEPKYGFLLLLSCIINYIMGNLIDKHRKYGKIFLIIALVYDIGSLLYFKYLDFFIENINNIFKSEIPLFHIIMPIGISFFTFQTISYVVDVYNKKVEPSKSFLNFATYVCLFPQLVAGPIVRYETIASELKNRESNFDTFALGVKRLTIGLAKKVLIANLLGEMCTSLASLSNGSVMSYLLGAVGYTLQIYFDFSGYSDMAIGLGLFFGFHFLENFNYPLIASSITDFWRRWHISLSSFFRDYVYIPLGGNRVSLLKWIRNIFIVWFLTGFWHGASWNFILWGLYFAVILVLEKKIYGKYLNNTKVLKYIYTIGLVVISFVIFNCETIGDIKIFLSSMFGLNNLPLINTETLYYIRSYLVLLIIAIIASTPLLKVIGNKIKKLEFLEPVIYIGIIILVTAYLVDTSFNPFLYFRF